MLFNLHQDQINLVVGDVFKIKGTAYGSWVHWIDWALLIVKWFNNHTRALGLLKSAASRSKITILALILPALTRWTSHYLCVHRLIEMKEAFQAVLLGSGKEELLVAAGDQPEHKAEAQNIISVISSSSFWSHLE